jgi:hypothetical protein
MECRYCKNPAVKYTVLENGARINLCQSHLETAESLGVKKEENL